jgi:hypothetical protein
VVAYRGTEDHIVGIVSSLIDASAIKRRRGESIKLLYRRSLLSSGYSAASLYSAPLQSSLCVRLCGLSCGRPCRACGTTFGLQHSVVVQGSAAVIAVCGRSCLCMRVSMRLAVRASVRASLLQGGLRYNAFPLRLTALGQLSQSPPGGFSSNQMLRARSSDS